MSPSPTALLGEPHRSTYEALPKEFTLRRTLCRPTRLLGRWFPGACIHRVRTRFGDDTGVLMEVYVERFARCDQVEVRATPSLGDDDIDLIVRFMLSTLDLLASQPEPSPPL